MNDAINPQHYQGVIVQGNEVQCIDMIEVLDLGFHLGNALKYAWRLGRKHDRIDEEISKCLWYLDRWRDQGHELRALRSSDLNIELHVEIAGQLRTMCETWRRRSARLPGAGAVVGDSSSWMGELITLLEIEAKLVAHVQRSGPGEVRRATDRVVKSWNS